MNFKEFLSLNESVLSLDKMFDMTKLKTYKSSDGKLDSVKTIFLVITMLKMVKPL